MHWPGPGPVTSAPLWGEGDKGAHLGGSEKPRSERGATPPQGWRRPRRTCPRASWRAAGVRGCVGPAKWGQPSRDGAGVTC